MFKEQKLQFSGSINLSGNWHCYRMFNCYRALSLFHMEDIFKKTISQLRYSKKRKLPGFRPAHLLSKNFRSLKKFNSTGQNNHEK